MSTEAERAAPDSKFSVGQKVLVPGVVEDVYWGGRTNAPKVRVSVEVTRMSVIVFDEAEVVALSHTARAPQPDPSQAFAALRGSVSEELRGFVMTREARIELENALWRCVDDAERALSTKEQP